MEEEEGEEEREDKGKKKKKKMTCERVEETQMCAKDDNKLTRRAK